MYQIYTDGSCKPSNPGFCGCGVVITKDDEEVHSICEYIGEGTNNIAELKAVLIALQWLRNKELAWESNSIFTDSSYVVGLLTKNWKPKKNKELVRELKDLYDEFPNTSVEWVKGHNNHEFNERADELANKAVDEGIP